MPDLARRLAAVRDRIAVACARAGRDAGSVRLVAVSKTRTADEMAELARLGQQDFGENRVQEAEEKRRAGLPDGVRLHLVGHLQANKAARAARLFDAIHSVDGRALLERLDRAAAGPLEVLVQVDLAGESTKHGLPPDRLEELLEAARRLDRVRVAGLMCLPPWEPDPERARPWFRRLRELRDAHGGAPRLPHLSMGMSHDFEVAIEEGATWVRIGEGIFGPRPAAGGGPAAPPARKP